MNKPAVEPDLLIHNARVFTAESAMPWAEAVAAYNGHILAAGPDRDVLALAGPSTRLLDLHGKIVLPGLCDAHIHFHDWSLSQAEVRLDDTTSKADMLQRIARRAANSPPGEWIIGRGWNESRWGKTEFPIANDIDSVTSPEQPAIFWRADMHTAVVNGTALIRAGITASTPDPAGGLIERDESGKPTGVLKELAIALVAEHLPETSSEQLLDALRHAMGSLHRLGVTAIHDQRMKDHDDGPRMLSALQELRRRHQLRLRVNCNLAAHQLPHLANLGLSSGFGDDYLRLGHVKIFTDGSLGSRTAWMLEPFEEHDSSGSANYGVNLTPPNQMAAEFQQASALGFPISVHAIGDRANRVCLDIFEELAQTGPQPHIPHRLEHVQIISPDDLPRLSQLGLTASVQPLHITDDMNTADLLVGGRGAHMYNFRSLMQHGTVVAFGSDAPVANANPFLGFHAAMFRQRPERMAEPPWYPNERISLEQTIVAYTMGAARAVGWHDTIGSIWPGKRADLIVLDRDIFAIARSQIQGGEIASTQVDMTIFDGQIVHERV